MFQPHPRIDADTALLGRLPLCEVRLHRDARYPWVLLVPARPGTEEIHALPAEERAQLVEEIAAVSTAMQEALAADKMNVAALGNMVPQLHVHVIARYRHDDAWPGAIWGAHPPLEYIGDAWDTQIARLREAFAPIAGFTAPAAPRGSEG